MTDQLVREAQAGLPAGLGGDQGQRRLRQLRARSAAGRSRAEPAASPARVGALHRARQEVGGRPQEPDDQGAGHAGRPRRAGRAGRRRRHAQRHADLLRRGSTRPPARPSGAAPSGARTSTRFKSVYSIFVSRVDVYTEKHVPRLSARRRRAWSASSTPSSSGARTRQFWADKSLPLQQEIIFASTGTKKKPRIRRTSTSRRSPAATSRPIRRPPTTPSRSSARLTRGRSTRCRRRRRARDRAEGRCSKARRSADARRGRQVREAPEGPARDHPGEARDACAGALSNRLQRT